jgi:glutathione S-transferase
MQMHLIIPASTGHIDRRKEIPMKLYYSPGACSLSPHIALHEAGLQHDLVKVDLKAKKTEKGDDFTAINPKGQVPALMLDSGELLTEGPVIVQVIADKAAGKNLAPANGSEARYKMQEWLNFTTSELHKNFSPLFNPAIPDEVKKFFTDRVISKFKYADSQLAGRDYLMGQQFTVADGYLFVMLSWAERMKIDLSEMKNLMAYKARVAARPNVQAALKMEGLLKAA